MTHVGFVEMSMTGAGLKTLEYARGRGYEVTLFARSPSKYAGAVPGGVDVVECETNDHGALLDAVRARDGVRPLDGVTTTHDLYTPQVATVVAALGLPGLAVDAVRRTRNKYEMRLALDDVAPELNPPFRLVRTPEEADAVASEWGLPLVAKPQDANDSWNVVRIDTRAQLDEYMRAAAGWTRNFAGQPMAPGVLLEGVIHGTEHAVDTAQHSGGDLTLMSVSGKVVMGEGGRYFAEVADYLPLTGPRVDATFRAVARALAGLGVDCGVVHTECRVQDDSVKILEINPRLAGDMTGSHLIELALGASAVEQVVEIAVGNPAPFRPTRRRGAAIHDVPMPRTGVFGGIGNLGEIRARAGVESAHEIAERGALCRFPPRYNLDLVGRVVATGETAEHALEIARDAAASARVAVRD